MIYLEKRWGNGEQITSWLVGRTRCFQLGVYSQYTRFARLITAKNRSQMIYIIALQRLFSGAAVNEPKKSTKKFQFRLSYQFCPRVPVHKNRYKRPNNVQQLNKGY